MSSARESHPHALAKRYVNLSIHTASIRQTLLFCHFRHLLLAKGQLGVKFDCLILSLRSTAITAASSLLQTGPPQCSASVLSSSWGFHLDFSVSIRTTGSRSSTEKPELDSRHLNAGHHLLRTQVPSRLFPMIGIAIGFDVTLYPFSTLNRWFIFIRLSSSYLARIMS